MRLVSPALRRSALVLLCLGGCAGSMAGTSGPPTARYAGPASVSSTASSSSSGDSDWGASSGAPDSQVAVPGGDSPAPSERPGLGTVWGEAVWSPVTTRPFVRAGAAPWATVVLGYNDGEGVNAQAAYFGGAVAPLEVAAGDGSLGIALVDEAGDLLPGVQAGGRALIVGQDGARYRIVIRNATDARFEVVTSVDGLDVIDGKPADPARRGYLIDPHGQLVIDGFRQSNDQVAAFRFGAVGASYAAITSGDRNVGIVGFAIFAEKGAVWTPAELQRRAVADPFPARTYAAPP